MKVWQEAKAQYEARQTGSGRATRRMKLRREDRLNEREDKRRVRREAK